MLERAKDILNKYGINNDVLAAEFERDEQVRALEVVLKNKHNPKDALNFKINNRLDDSNEFEALKLGLKVEQALMFRHSIHLEALKLLGIDKADLAACFETHQQVRALEVVLKNKHNPEDALKFKSPFINDLDFEALKLGLKVEQALIFNTDSKFNALKLLGIDKADLAARFETHQQVKVLEVVLKNKHNPEDALKFKSPYINALDFEALKLGLKVEQALMFNTDSKFNALKLLGIDKADLAARFGTHQQFKALEVVLQNKHNPEDALNFKINSRLDDSNEFEALKLGLTVEQALMFTHSVHLEALKLGLTVKQALMFDQKIKIQALKLLGVDKADLAAKFENHQQVDALEVVLKNKHNPEDALKFTIILNYTRYIEVFEALKFGLTIEQALMVDLSSKFSAVKFLGIDRFEDSLKFLKESQVEALESLGVGKVDQALLFTKPEQVNALKILKSDHFEDALKFEKDWQVKALDICNMYEDMQQVEHALKVQSKVQFDALKFALDAKVPVTDSIFEIYTEAQFDEFIHSLPSDYLSAHPEL